MYYFYHQLDLFLCLSKEAPTFCALIKIMCGVKLSYQLEKEIEILYLGLAFNF